MTVFQKQCVLAYLGYYEGEMDGQLGPLTEEATKAFQKDYGLAIDGVYGDGTHAKASEVIASKEKSVIQSKREEAGLAPGGAQEKPADKPTGDWPDCPNFTKAEFACKCGCGFDDVAHKLVQNCQTVRDHFDAPFLPSSGCRCKAHNARVGGVYNSRHMACADGTGHAVDFAVKGRSSAEVDAFVATLPGIVFHYCIDGDYVHMDIGVIAMEWFNQAAGYISSGLTILSGLAVLAGLIVAGAKIWDGIKCILRSEMLHIYYEYKDTEKIRQYELENFVMMYKAYKAMHGNSFIEVIYKEVISWEVIT